MENLTELLPSFDETVEQQAEKLASKQRNELRNNFKIEQDDVNSECKKMRLKTEELVKDIGRVTRKFAQDFKWKHNANLRAITSRENGEELDIIIAEATNYTDGDEIYEQPDSSVLPKCATCGKASVWLYFCEACKVTRYCNEKCQTKDWKNHKDICIGLRHN